MNPRSNAQIVIEPVPRTEIDKTAQIALAGPIELSLHFLMMNPDHIGGYNLHSTRFHLEDFALPLAFWITRIVEFSHYGEPWLAIHCQISAVHPDAMTSHRERRTWRIGRVAGGDHWL